MFFSPLLCLGSPSRWIFTSWPGLSCPCLGFFRYFSLLYILRDFLKIFSQFLFLFLLSSVFLFPSLCCFSRHVHKLNSFGSLIAFLFFYIVTSSFFYVLISFFNIFEDIKDTLEVLSCFWCYLYFLWSQF